MNRIRFARSTCIIEIAAALLVANGAYAAGKRAELDGVWILLRADIGKLQLTPAGEKLRAAYDFQKDDPDFQCKPASFTRIMKQFCISSQFCSPHMISLAGSGLYLLFAELS